jgi:dienelactone hydrolase
MPAGEGPFPAVVLVHGSGPHDRDESIGPNKPFRELAWGLGARGIAVLRYEKRTKEYAAKIKPLMRGITVKEETIDDALAAVALLKTTKGINPKKIFVLGHSLGGALIPRIGARDDGIAGFIVLAGSARPLEDVILEQMEYILSRKGTPSPQEKAEIDKLKAQVANVKSPALSESTPDGDLPFGIPARYWLDLRGYSPPEAAARLKQPMLIMQGGRDYQVSVADFEGWKKALGSRPNVTLTIYPTLNHLFVAGEGKCRPEELLIRKRMDEHVIDDIAGWIKKQ